MSEPVTALRGATAPGPVTVSEAPVQGMITLRGKLDDAAIAGPLAQVSGLSVPGQRGLAIEGARRLAWMGPDEALLVVPRSDLAATLAGLTDALQGQHALVADVSDARAVFRLTGEDRLVRATLARLMPVDFGPGGFGPGQVRRSRLAQVAAAIWMPAEGTAELVTFRSVARYAFDLLAQAAASPEI